MPNFEKTTIRNRIHLLKSIFDNTEEILIGYQVYNLAKLDNNSIIFGDENDEATYLVGNRVELIANDSITFTAPNFILDGNLTVKGNTVLEKTLNVTGVTTLNNKLNVMGNVDIGNTYNDYSLHVHGSCTINKDLYVTGTEAKKTLLNTALEVRDDASFKSDVYFYTNQNDEIIKKGYISALAKEVKVSSINTTVYGINICALSNTINLLSDCNVYGDMYLYKSLTIDSSLTVNDESVFKKAIYLDSGKYRYITGLEKTINCSNNSVFETGKATVNGITIGANVDYVTSINLAGHCKVYDNLTVYGNSFLYGTVTIGSTLLVLSTTRLDGKLILKESYTYGANAPQNATEGQIFFEYI